MMQESRNPIYGVSNDSLDVLKGMAEEIREGIYNLSPTDVDKADIQNDIEQIIAASAKEKSAEAVLNLLLFRKYADIANFLKENQHTEGLLGDLPSFVYETNEDHLTGWSALGEKIFWFRLAVSILAFISFVVMSTIPYISYAEFHPSVTFFHDCPYNNVTGSFNYQPFQFVLVCGVVIFFYNALFAIYYVLPTDVDKKKFIPGFGWLLGQCVAQSRADHFSNSASLFCMQFSKFIASFLDGAMLFLSLIAAIIGSIVVERSTKFTFFYNQTFQVLKPYFTIGSFYATFSATNPNCVDEANDPGPRIRASLAMMYFTTFLLALCFLVSLTAFRKELRGSSGRVQVSTSGGQQSSEEDEQTVNFSSLPQHSQHDTETV